MKITLLRTVLHRAFFYTAFLAVFSSFASAAPQIIDDLTATTSWQIRLTWTAPHNGVAGQKCGSYLVKYSTWSTLNTDAAFTAASTFPQAWVPATPGTTETKILTGLPPGKTVWFSIKSSSNTTWSVISTTSTVSKAVPSSFLYTVLYSAAKGLYYGANVWGDYDNDGDLDLAMTGFDATNRFAFIYRNDNGTMNDINAGLDGAGGSAAAWGDFDNDGDLDLAYGGVTDAGTARIFRVCRNDSGEFSTMMLDVPDALRYVSLDAGDYDNDGDLDLVTVGQPGTAGYETRLYRNDGGSFSVNTSTPAGGCNGAVRWGDYDNDGDLDLAITGSGSGRICTVYRNDSGTFVTRANLTGITWSALAWGDYDNDGDLDLAATGTYGTDNLSCIYQNTGGTFTDINAGLPGLTLSSVAWGDYDNDGDLDLSLSGSTGTVTMHTIYRNNSGTFADAGAALPGVDYSMGSAAWGDYDNDGDLDLVISGRPSTAANIGVTRLYKFMEPEFYDLENDAPAVPSGFSSAYNSATGKVNLRWNYGSTDETATAGLNYEIRVATNTTSDSLKQWVVSPSIGAGASPFMGNYPHGFCNGATQPGCNFTPLLADGTTYYWQVRTIDAGFKKSAWSAVQSYKFTTSADVPPTVNSGTPVGTSVAVNSSIAIGFSEAMSTTTVKDAFTISPTVAGNFTWSGNTMTFDPAADLQNGTTYTVTVTVDAKDEGGTAMTGPYSWQFTTVSSQTANTPPSVVSKTPAGNTVSLDSSITVGFSEAMNQGTAETAFSVSPSVPGSFSWAGNTMTFDPSSTLQYNTTYTVTVTTAAEDIDGAALTAKCTWQFTTVINPPPTVITKMPQGNTIAVSTSITVGFSEAMDQSTVETAFSISPSVTGSLSWTGNAMTFTPANDLQYSRVYTVTVTTAAKDLAGAALAAKCTWQFTTEVNWPPAVVAKTPQGGSASISGAITARFSEAMDKSAAEAAFSLAPPAAGSFSWDGNTLVFVPAAALEYFTLYTVTITTVAKDQSGLKMTATHTWQFTTERSTPQITVAGPMDGLPVFGPTVVQAEISDPVGIVQVEFYLDGTLVKTLTAPPYTWDWDPGSAAAGTHTVRITARNSDGGTSEKVITLKNVKAAKEVIYPNPYIKGKSVGAARITFGNLPGGCTIRIYTVSEELVATIQHGQAADGGSEEWDISGVGGGIYIYAITDGGSTRTGKIGIIK